jgi:ureidoacrylate peracid hydrolase
MALKPPAGDLQRLTNPANTAVVIVDVQNDFCARGGGQDKTGKDLTDVLAMLPVMQRFVEAARRHGTAVIFVQTIHDGMTDSDAIVNIRKAGAVSNCDKDTWGAELTISPLPNESVVIKHRYSGFVNTRLDSVLRTLQIENILIGGVSTNVCVESTSRHAYMLDYNVVFVGDCAAAYDRASHDMALNVHRKHFGVVATADEIIDTWTAAHSFAAPNFGAAE